MKVFRYALFATLVIGVLLSGLMPRTADAVVHLERICTGSYGYGYWGSDGAVHPAYSCHYEWIYERTGYGHAPTSDRLSGGGVGGTTASNKGDTQTVQRDARVKPGCGEKAGEPVVLSTGNEVMPEVDFHSVGEMSLSLTRTYNHYWNGIGIFGRRWLSDYDYKLLFTTHDPTSTCYTRPGNTPCDPTGQPIWALRPDGRLIKFNYSTIPTPGWYEAKPSPIAKIIKTGSTYTLYSEDHTIETYDDHGFPSVISDQQGVSWTFSYDASHYLTRVTQSSGRHVDFGWINGRLVQITDPAGNVYHYSYTTIPVSADTLAASSSMSLMLRKDGGLDDPPPIPYNPPIQTMTTLLASATQPGTQGGAPATIITYHYEDSRFITALTGKSINGSRYSWITYDANAMAIETKLAGGVEDYHFAYTLDSNGAITSTTVTNPLGRVTTYDYNASGQRTAVTGVASTSCPARVRTLTYDDNGYLAGTTDFKGNVTLFTYAANGQLQQEVRGSGSSTEQTINYEWNAANHRPAKITLVGDHSTNYGYDAHNRLTSVTVTSQSSAVSDSLGKTHTTTYTYTTWPNHLVKSLVIDGPLPGTGDTTTLSYSEAGDLLSAQDVLGHTTTYGGYNALGLPGYIIGPNGAKRSYVYDARGRVADEQTHRNGGTQHTYYQYDGFGQLSKVIQPDGHSISYQYDIAGRLTAKYEPEGDGTYDETVYTYNAMSLPITVKTQRVFAEPQRGTVP